MCSMLSSIPVKFSFVCKWNPARGRNTPNLRSFVVNLVFSTRVKMGLRCNLLPGHYFVVIKYCNLLLYLLQPLFGVIESLSGVLQGTLEVRHLLGLRSNLFGQHLHLEVQAFFVRLEATYAVFCIVL